MSEEQSNDLEQLTEQGQMEIAQDLLRNKTILARAGAFMSEEAKWILHGMPFRSIDDVNHIYYNICTSCEFFENDACKICTCRIVPNERGPLNKLSMATTNCALPNAPKWISGITPPNTLDPELVAEISGKSRADITETTVSENELLSESTRETIEHIKKKQEDAATANPFRRTSTGQFVQGEQE